MTLREQYPDAFEDDHGTVWTSKQASLEADWTFEHGGDGFMEEILGWDWEEAEENFILSQKIAKRKAFWKTHPRLRDTLWFLRRWYGAVALFIGTVGREWNEVRIGPALAWELASDVWLR